MHDQHILRNRIGRNFRMMIIVSQLSDYSKKYKTEKKSLRHSYKENKARLHWTDSILSDT